MCHLCTLLIVVGNYILFVLFLFLHMLTQKTAYSWESGFHIYEQVCHVIPVNSLKLLSPHMFLSFSLGIGVHL